ncbi:MAG: hypothetical protein ACQESR_27175 [Planctomycetota bacterium]
MESCPAQAVRPLVGLAAEKVIRDGVYFNPLRTGWDSPASPFTVSRTGTISSSGRS